MHCYNEDQQGHPEVKNVDININDVNEVLIKSYSNNSANTVY